MEQFQKLVVALAAAVAVAVAVAAVVVVNWDIWGKMGKILKIWFQMSYHSYIHKCFKATM